MKLVKALESGRPFRMVGGTSYYTAFQGTVTGEGGQSRGIALADLQSDDWELEPKDVKVTRSDLESAMSGVVTPQQCETIMGNLGL